MNTYNIFYCTVTWKLIVSRYPIQKIIRIPLIGIKESISIQHLWQRYRPYIYTGKTIIDCQFEFQDGFLTHDIYEARCHAKQLIENPNY